MVSSNKAFGFTLGFQCLGSGFKPRLGFLVFVVLTCAHLFVPGREKGQTDVSYEHNNGSGLKQGT